MKKKILITGIGGYLGSTFANVLFSTYNVAGFGHDKNFSRLREVFGSKIKLISGDIVDKKTLLKAMKGAHVVVHTAAPTTEKFCKEHTRKATQSIVRGTRLVYEAAVFNKVKLFIHISTQAVYSNFKTRKMPLKESDTLMPDTLYGTLKAKAEHELINQVSNVKGQVPKVVILRPSNIYGIGDSGTLRNNVVHTFVIKAKRGESLVLNGGGGQKVDFVHVKDVARLIEKIIKSHRPQGFALEPLILNVGFGKAVSIRSIAELVAGETEKLFGKKTKIISKSTPKSKIATDRWLSIKRAEKTLKWKPKISLKEGVKELISDL